MGRKLVSSRDAIEAPKQHTKPCSDCPCSRESLPGWLGGSTAEDYVQLLHSDAVVPCHCISNQQCAGVAIYRANVCKTPRPGSGNLKLPKDTESVFATPQEFLEHHAERARLMTTDLPDREDDGDNAWFHDPDMGDR